MGSTVSDGRSPGARILTKSMQPELLAILRCPSCGSPLERTVDAIERSSELRCRSCPRKVPIVDDIPRFLDQPDGELARRTQASFGYEWSHFNDWRPSGDTNFQDYFQGLDLTSLQNDLVLDAGCGMGRHARQIARYAQRLVAVDFSSAINQAQQNVAGLPNVQCIQADLLSLPLADASFDFVYSLGVLHHLEETERALKGLVRKLRPGGRLRIYLYWRRRGASAAVLAAITAIRWATVRLPFPVLRALCAPVSVALFGGVVIPYRLLSAAGFQCHREWPLFVYTKYPFNVLYNDQFDRFSAPIEKRYDREEVQSLLEAAGLRDVRVRPCFGWIADGMRPV